MDTSYKAQSGEDQYQFLAEQLAAGIKVPVARLVHGPTGSPLPVAPATPMPVHDPMGATQDGQQAIVTALNAVATMLSSHPTAVGQAAIVSALQTLLLQTDGVEGSLTSILNKLPSDPATASAQAAEVAKLTSIDGKLPALSGSRVPSESDDRVLASLIDESTVGTTYVCEAPAGTATSAAGWRIQRIVVAGNVTRITWAAGGAMTQVADNRSSLTYA